MSFANRYIETAEKIIKSYDGSVPLHHYLKQFFAADKKYGSKDRKAISHTCYCYFRLGKALEDKPVAEKIKAGIFLCNNHPGIWETIFEDTWFNNWSSDQDERVTFLEIKGEDIFPLQSELTEAIDKKAFSLSHLLQPDLYLRTRPGKHQKVLEQLTTAGILFQECDKNSIALPNSTKIDKVLQLNRDVVVQDLSSQRIAEFLSSAISDLPTTKVWDCCAASGGKSILAYDTLRNINLTVSDIRPSIIQNLKKRFAEAGIRNYKSFVCDLTANSRPPSARYNLIICDAPCSGSGTWSRTPEQLSFFKQEKIDYYKSLQQKIISSTIPALAADGYFLYITCSVFKKENEEMVDYIKANSSLQLVKMQYFEGYEKKADTMFAALFTASRP